MRRVEADFELPAFDRRAGDLDDEGVPPFKRFEICERVEAAEHRRRTTENPIDLEPYQITELEAAPGIEPGYRALQYHRDPKKSLVRDHF